MVYYTKLDDQKYGLLMFKVIGARSQQEAEAITAENWGEALMKGRTLDGPPTICPLFSDLKPGQHSSTT